MGLVAGFAALALPGVGPILVAGPLVSALGGAAVGGAVGGLAGGSGAFHPLGLPKEVAHRIEERLRSGDILISIHSDDPDVLRRAGNLFQTAGAGIVGPAEQDRAA